MKAVILAAGQGVRMGALTKSRPKCMTELAGKTLLERQVETLRRAGCNDITVVTGYCAEAIADFGTAFVRNPDFAKSNMVTTLFCARAAMTASRDLVVSYGDIVYEERVARAMLACNAPICLPIDVEWRRYWGLRMPDPLADAETLKLDASGHVLELGKKPKGYHDIQGQFMGMFKVRADRVEQFIASYDAMNRTALYDGQPFPKMYTTSFLQYLIDSGWHIQSVPVKNGWLELDTPADLALYARLHKTGELDPFCKLA
jgi:choline kinase